MFLRGVLQFSAFMICFRMFRHTEAVQVYWDPTKVSFADLMREFLLCHDPTQVPRIPLLSLRSGSGIREVILGVACVTYTLDNLELYLVAVNNSTTIVSDIMSWNFDLALGKSPRQRSRHSVSLG